MSKREDLERLLKGCAYLLVVLGEIEPDSSPLHTVSLELVEDMIITAKIKYEKRYGKEAFDNFAKETGFSIEC
jgi:hypothetical protein